MEDERVQITIEQELEIYKARLDYASQLLSLVVAKLGGSYELIGEELEAKVNGVQIENLENGIKVTTFTDEPEES